jgi:hypothetical protein
MKPPIIVFSPVCTNERVLMLPSHDVDDVPDGAVTARVLALPTSQMSVTRKDSRRSLFISLGNVAI